MEDCLSSLLLSVQDLVVLAAIGNREAASYNTDLNARVGILVMMIGLGGLIIMIGFRARQAEEEKEQPPHMNTTSSSNWIASGLFLIGWGMAVAGAFFVVTIFLRAISYYADRSRWCYECSGWEWTLGPELSMVAGAISLATLVAGIVMIATKGRRTLVAIG